MKVCDFRARSKKASSFLYTLPFEMLIYEELLCCKATWVVLWKGPCGKELRLPVKWSYDSHSLVNGQWKMKKSHQQAREYTILKWILQFQSSLHDSRPRWYPDGNLMRDSKLEQPSLASSWPSETGKLQIFVTISH